MRTIRNVFMNVYFLSLIPFILVVIFTPINIKKYNLEIISTEAIVPGNYVNYDDLDGDGFSEKITAFDEFNSAGIYINGKEGIIDQWNFRGGLNFGLKKCLFITGDRNNNGKKEIYVFTLSTDSILLHCISDKLITTPEFANRFISTTGKGLRSPDPCIIPGEMDDLNGDGEKELIFGIATGFSETPRQVYAYYISKDSLVTSPESSYFIYYILQEDVNNDGKREIIPYGYAAGNIGPERATYHDYSSFLMVLDQNLRFLYKPREFKGKYSMICPFIHKINDEYSFAAMFSPQSTKSSSVIYNVNSEGELIDSLKLGFKAAYLVRNRDEFLTIADGEGYRLMDNEFRTLRRIPVNIPGHYLTGDFDVDNNLEYMIYFPEQSKLSIFREGLKSEASTLISIPIVPTDLFSVRTGYGTKPAISIQTPTNRFLLVYGKNPYVLFAYLLYLLIYLFILGFSILLRQISRAQLNRKYENEKKISELQMALIRNQLDPHFTLNAINTIIYSVNYGDRDIAADQLRRFASLYRNLVLSAGSSQRSIEDEIAFCENYLNLEKMRFGDRFSFAINLGNDIDQTIMIPKFLIQIHAENAVKHGLEPLESGGFLMIRISKESKDLIIEISDNGIGRKASETNLRTSTGRGLEIMDELYSIHNKIHKNKISSEITDLFDINGVPEGTKVLIRIQEAAIA